MEPPLKSPAMILFVFQILVFCSEVVYTLVLAADLVSMNLKMSHFDCGAKTDDTLYELTQVRQCHITPEELETSQTKINLYTKHFRKCLMQQNVEYNIISKNGTADIMTTAALITLLLELLVT